MRYIKDLSKEEQQQLETGFRRGATHRYRIRCQSILLSNQGHNINQLTSMFDVDRDTISRWLNWPAMPYGQ
ncbi:MAG: helix-turn-helix domain-containing protein [Bacteroidota bacterium]